MEAFCFCGGIMGIRVTEDDVAKIIDWEADDITHFIATASLMVDEVLVDSGFTDARLKQIELYLTAHMITVTERQLASEGVGEVSESYGALGMGLNSSTYGQTALMLDTTGLLKGASEGKNSISDITVF